MEKTIFNLFDFAIDLVNKLIYILISLALVVFLWGIVKYLFNATNPESRKEARSYMIYGVITLFVMTSVWSIVYLFKDFLGGSTQPAVSAQQFKVNSGTQTYDTFSDFGNLDDY